MNKFRGGRRYFNRGKKFYFHKQKGPFKKPGHSTRIFLGIGIRNNDPLKKALFDPVYALTSSRSFHVRPGGRPEIYEMQGINLGSSHLWERNHLGLRTPEHLGMNSVLPGFHGLRDGPSHY